jgi:hypothetical protein
MDQRSGYERSAALRQVAAIAACLLLAAGGLHAGSPGDSRSPAATPDRAIGAPPAIDDKSLPDDRYVSLGFPSYDRAWTGIDVEAAAKRLTALAASHPEQLPRFESDKSGKTFARIAAPMDASFLRRRSLSLAVRLPEALQYLEATNSIFELYVSAFAAKQVAGAELAELFGGQLKNCMVMLELIDEFLPTVAKDDPSYPERMAGLEEMLGGVAEAVMGAMTTLTEEEAYSAGTRLKLLGYCRETFPSIVPRLTGASQAEVRHRLDELVADPKLRELRPQLLSLRDALRAAPKATPKAPLEEGTRQ